MNQPSASCATLDEQPGATAMSGAPLATPYVGPRTYTIDQAALFFGREREARDLLALVIANRVMLFFAQSGAGKSSLINTRLIPGLQTKGFEVLPVGRVGGDRTAGWQVTNIYIYNLMVTLDQSHADDRRLADLPLSDFLTSLALVDGRWVYSGNVATLGATGHDEKPDGFSKTRQVTSAPASGAVLNDESLAGDDFQIAPRALIIDQFEELLTTHPDQWAKREAFFRAVRQALDDDPFLWLVLALREDYVAALSPFAHLLPGGLRARYYMQRMEESAAFEAIAEPARLGGRPFAPGVVQVLVDNLRQVRMMGQTQPQPGQFVEPVQLQVVCYQLWEKLRANPPQPIQLADLVRCGDVDSALAEYYEETLSAVLADPQCPCSERKLRGWFDQVLITANGLRNFVLQEATTTAGMANAVVKQLQDRFLLHSENRGGGLWFELVHDRFVRPIQAANDAWAAVNSNPLAAVTQAWLAAGRDTEKLLRGELLSAAQRYADQNWHDLSADEQELLATSARRQADLDHLRAVEKRKRAEAKKFRRGVMAMAIALLVLLTAIVVVGWLFSKAQQARDAVQALRLAAESMSARTTSPELGLLLAVEASKLLVPDTGKPAPEAVQALRAQFDQWNYWQQALRDTGKSVRVVRFGRQDDQLFSADIDGRLLAWQVDQQGAQAHELLRIHQAVDAVAFHPTQDWLALGTEQGQIQVVSLQEPSTVLGVWQAHTAQTRVLALAFSADGRKLVSSGADGLIKFWYSNSFSQNEVQKIALPNQAECLPECWVRALDISTDGQWLAAGAQNQHLYLWHLAGDQPPTLVLNTKLLGVVRAVAFSHDNAWLAAGDEAGVITLYKMADVQSGATGEIKPRHHLDITQLAQVHTLAFSPMQPLLAIGDDSGVVGTLPIGEQVGEFRVLGRLDAAINAVAFSPSGNAVASAVADNEATATADSHVTLWHVTPINPEPHMLLGHAARVRALVFHSAPLTNRQATRSTTLVSAGEDETVRFWSLAAQVTAVAVITETGNRILAAAISPNGHWLATGGRDGRVRLYPLPYIVSPPTILGEHDGEIVTVAFSPDSTQLATGASDQHILIWSLDHPQQAPQVLDNIQGGILALAFSANGRLLAAGDEARRVKLWNLAQSPSSARILYTHNDWVWAVAFSPDGRYLATTGADSMIHLTPLVDGVDAQGPIFAHRQRARSLIYNPAGDVLASAGDDASVKLWNPNNLNETPVELLQHTGIVRALAFSPDGTYLASAGDDNTIQMWTVRLTDLQQMACQRAARNLAEEEWRRFFPYIERRDPCPDLYP